MKARRHGRFSLAVAAVGLLPLPRATGGHAPEVLLPDVSSDVCWIGSWTKDECCKGDASTHPECWDSLYSFGECCPNADCWEGDTFTYERCCDKNLGPGGNVGCWSGVFTYDHCCLANSTAQSWVDVMAGAVDTEQFYTMDEFYTDAQYGDDFGYYSTGRVLRSTPGKAHQQQDTQQFAHFTTYPMAMSPHFARVFCRILFVMWVNLGERTPFRVVEMGAGSGQLAVDIQKCVWNNDLGVAPAPWRRWVAAFEYLIMERSPALAQRQRERGLRVVHGDAQSSTSCQPVLSALTASAACSGPAATGAPECKATEFGTPETSASVVLSNELLDAFAPVKLRLSLYGSPNITDCLAWQELRMVHTIPESELRKIMGLMAFSEDSMEKYLEELHSYTHDTFCGMANSTVGREARERVEPGTSCLALVLGLSELLYHVDLGVPAASHNMRLRLRKDQKLWGRLREIVGYLEEQLRDAVALPRDIYRQLRHQLKGAPDVEVHFLSTTNTRFLPVTITQSRCDQLTWWFAAHEVRIARLAKFYAALGYPALHIVVRPGERNFIDLVDCLLGPSGGFKLTIDYGASFEPLAHSLSIDPRNDGIFVPPIPQELMQDLPECHSFWPTCAGRIDWTTFVDFTNLAAAGERLGWRTLFYGSQSLLEHASRYNVTVFGKPYSVPGYLVAKFTDDTRHVRSWYGRETLASERETSHWVQRWTSFKALLLEKPAGLPTHPRSSGAAGTPVVLFPSWHLDSQEADACWRIDPTTVPLADWIPRQNQSDPGKALEALTTEINDGLGREYSLVYEEAQLAVRLVDWLVATEGCKNLRQATSLLGSDGLWASFRTRLARSWWATMWGEEAVVRIARGILERVAQGSDADLEASPPICAGQQTYTALCESPGGAGSMAWGTGPA